MDCTQCPLWVSSQSRIQESTLRSRPTTSAGCTLGPGLLEPFITLSAVHGDGLVLVLIKLPFREPYDVAGGLH